MQQVGKVAVAFGLDGFLQGIEVQDQGIRFAHVYCAAALFQAVAVVKLHCANIGKKQNVGGHLADVVGVGQGTIFDGGSLGAKPHGDAHRLRGFRQNAVDFSGLGGAAGHGGNEQGRAQRFAKDGNGRIHRC